MKTIEIIDTESFQELLNKIEQINEKLNSLQKPEHDLNRWITNEEACKSLDVSSRTMQTYRDNGIISFSQIGSKIYYKWEDIENHLRSNYKRSFIKGRRSA